MNEDITLSLEKLQHLFDIAVASPTVCSGSCETIDVELLREIARMIGVNPNDITPDEFAGQYPHSFLRRRVRAEPISVYAYGAHHMRMETAQEQRERMDQERNDPACQVRRCGKPAEDPIHQGVSL